MDEWINAGQVGPSVSIPFVIWDLIIFSEDASPVSEF